jgi:hypothetical protein
MPIQQAGLQRWTRAPGHLEPGTAHGNTLQHSGIDVFLPRKLLVIRPTSSMCNRHTDGVVVLSVCL